MEKTLLTVIEGKKAEKIPVWLMRQAGRYLPSYRKFREKYDFLSLCLTPELAAEVTLQPVDILNVDASIIFSDILIPAFSLGLEFDFYEGKGPIFKKPVSSFEDIENLRSGDLTDELFMTGEAIKIVQQKLSPDKAVIGFCASPFTLACYLIEGKGSKVFAKTKSFIHENPSQFEKLMEKNTSVLTNFLKIQAEAGADILQIFDTWGGILSPADFRKFALPWLEKLISGFRETFSQPLIYFIRSSGELLPLCKNLPVEVMSVDWSVSLLKASSLLGNRYVLQGNLDPSVLLQSKEVIKKETCRIVEEGRELKGHIFNLGHGILSQTPVENARFLIELVHNF